MPPKTGKGFYHTYSSTLFIFPVFLPLAELLPWLLTVIAALAACVQFLSRSVWKHKRNRIILLCICGICLVAAGALVGQRLLYTPPVSKGSVSVSANDFSTLEIFHPVPASYTPPHAPTQTLLWSVTTPHQNIGKPTIAGTLLMAGSYNATVDAFSLADGTTVWSLHKHEQVFSTPVITGAMAFVGEGHHDSPASVLTGFSFPDGKPVWERTFRSHLESYPLVDQPGYRLWLGGGETGLWALKTDNGDVLWWNPIGHIDVPPLMMEGRLFSAAQLAEDKPGAALFELDPATGKILHSTALPGNPMGNLLGDAVHHQMYLGTATGQVGVKRYSDKGWAHSFDRNGTLRWTRRLPAMPMPEGVLLKDGSLLFYTLADGTLLALHTSDGSTAWQQKISDEFNTDAALIEDNDTPLIVAVLPIGVVTIRNAQSGAELTHFPVERGDAYPLYHDGILYIVTPRTIRAYAGVGH